MAPSHRATAVPVTFVAAHGRLGGAERYLESLVGALGGDWVHDVVCLGDGPFPERLRRRGHAVGVIKAGRRLGMLLAAWRLRRRLRRRRPAVVHANGIKAALVCVLATPMTGIPVVWLKHDHFRDGWLANLIAWRCRLVVGVSASVNRTFRPELHNRLRVVHNGVPDLPVDRGAGRRLVGELLGFPPNQVVLLVGRLDPLKGAGELLEIAPQVLNRRPGVTFAVLGGDEPHHPGYRAWLERRAEQLGIAEAVVFLEAREDAVAVMSGCDVVVVPSLPGKGGIGREGFPLVAIEALWVGTPVAGYADGGLPEAVGDAARLVGPGDRAALARVVGELLADEALRDALASRGMARVRERNRFARVVEQLAETYRFESARG